MSLVCWGIGPPDSFGGALLALNDRLLFPPIVLRLAGDWPTFSRIYAPPP